MTLKSAIRNLREGEACKRPSMCGYVTKDVSGLSEDEVSAGKYRLVFVNRDGGRVSFPMGGLEEPTDGSISADAEFVGNLIEDNWDVSAMSDLESARSGKGNW